MAHSTEITTHHEGEMAEITYFPFSLPAQGTPEREDYARLPDAPRRALDLLVEQLRLVDSYLQPAVQAARGLHSPRKSYARSLSAACKLVGGYEGVHPKKLERNYRAYIDSGFNWKQLVDRRHVPAWWKTDNYPQLAPEFLEHWRGLCERNQRSSRRAHAKLLSDLTAWRRGHGEPIPGYNRPPANHPNTNHPRGWSYRNLLNHAPEALELAAARQGRDAAKKLLPTVRTTRVELYCFAEIQFDDMWHDFEVNVLGTGERSSRRLLEFGAVDVFSSLIFPPALKPRLRSLDDGKMKALNEADFRFYLAHFLTQFGYSPRGTILNMEHGTTTLREEHIQALALATDGLVMVRKGGIHHSDRAAFLGAHGGRRKGNFRTKALKEGLGRLIHAELAALPGQVGQSADLMPSEYHGRARDNELLLAITQLFPQVAKDLAYGFLDFPQASRAIHECYARINESRDRTLEGWEEAGLVKKEFRLNPLADEWMPVEVLDTYPAPQRERIVEMVAADPIFRRVRPMTSAEVMQEKRGELIKLPISALPGLLGRDLGQVRSVRSATFEFKLAPEDPAPTQWLAEIKDQYGFPTRLTEGREYMVFANPFDPARLAVCDKDSGAYLGFCKRWDKVSRADTDAIYRQHAELEELYADAVRGVAVRANLSPAEGSRKRSLATNAAALKKLATNGQTLAEKRKIIADKAKITRASNQASSESDMTVDDFAALMGKQDTPDEAASIDLESMQADFAEDEF
ncbi:MAG: hypothetical protein E1N59_2852 [Puniceicoccaceae bacterium 5H]|nr:MAG: hypothetical protein E1N59_2852 [Puniceicoccaceae bacterium 5H]